MLLFVLATQIPVIKVRYAQYFYDLKHPQKAVASFEQTQKIIQQFPRKEFRQLPKTYLEKTKSSNPKYKKMLQNSQYRVLKGDAIFQKLIGHYRIKDFLPHDTYYNKNIRNLAAQHEIYWLVNEKLFKKFHALRQVLAQSGYNPNAFGINNGYRHPAYNEGVGGASKSRHILGEAIDIQIKDINQDGRISQKDKEIVLDILEKKVIKNEGGIGRYPGTMVVHFDVRGHRARWDSY